MSRWQDTIRHVIATRPWLPYAPAGLSSGPSEDLFWRSERILAAKEFTSCVAATFEALTLAMAQFPALVSALDPGDMKWLQRRTYIIKGTPGFNDGWVNGVAGGLIEMGVADSVAWKDAQPGDVAQIQWDASEDPWRGHSVVIMSEPTQHPSGSGAAVLWAYSANIPAPRYLPPWGAEPSWVAQKRAGSQVDYFSREKAGKDRVWHIARLKPELVA